VIFEELEAVTEKSIQLIASDAERRAFFESVIRI
jgi:hypothetical protein